MKRWLALFLALASAPALADATAEVRCREIAFSLSAETRDWDAFTSFLDADARFVGTTVRRGPADIAEAWSVFLKPDGPAIKWRPEFVEVLADGALALTRGPWLVVAQDDSGQTTEQWGTFNSVWRQGADGEWRVVFDAGNASAGPIPDASRALLEADTNCATD